MDEPGSTQPASPTAPPGWYPDPGGGLNLAYWDGTRWTGDLHTPVQPARSQSRREALDTGRRLVVAGGVGLAISPLLPWVKVVLLGDLNLFQLFSAAGRPSIWPWAAVLGGGAAALVAWQDDSFPRVRITSVIIGSLGGLLALYALGSLRHDIREVHGLAAIGIGPYVAVAGCVAMFVGGFLAGERRRRLSPGAQRLP